LPDVASLIRATIAAAKTRIPGGVSIGAGPLRLRIISAIRTQSAGDLRVARFPRLDCPAIRCCTAPIAVRQSIFGVGLQNIVDSVVSSYGAEVSRPAQEKLFNYIRLLASTGLTDEKLLTFGRAYLREMLEPDPRYTGC
jgi:hypothetical protein